jgi:hypothetical protein
MLIETLCDNCRRPFMCDEEKVDQNDVLCEDCLSDLNLWNIDEEEV